MSSFLCFCIFPFYTQYSLPLNIGFLFYLESFHGRSDLYDASPAPGLLAALSGI